MCPLIVERGVVRREKRESREVREAPVSDRLMGERAEMSCDSKIKEIDNEVRWGLVC